MDAPRLLRLAAPLALSALALGLAAPRPVVAQEPPCNTMELEYATAGSLRLSDTPMGQGDGKYPVGPGKMVLRVAKEGDELGGAASLRSYSMPQHLRLSAKTVFWRTTVTSDLLARVTPDSCGSAAEGTLSKHVLRWNGPVRGYRTDGTMVCEGSLCGKFGAPPSGKSEIHIGPGPVTFLPFVFAEDGKTLTMNEIFVSKTDMPKQTAHLSLSAREVRRTCVQAPVACK